MQRPSLLVRRALAQSRQYSSLRATTSKFYHQPRLTLPRLSTPVRPQWHKLSNPNLRHNSSLTVPESESTNETERPIVPSYQLTFTCKPCQHRSSHTITKQGYHHGTVLITCPNCRSRHIISDHMKIFMDEASTLEDILKRTAGTEKDLSKLLKKGRLGQRQGQLVGNEDEQDLEFWDDGTTSKYTPA